MISVRIFKALGETEINDVNIVLGRFSRSNQEIVWFNIAMDDALFVNLLNTLNLHKSG